MQRELQILDTSSTDGNVKNKKRVTTFSVLLVYE